MVQYAPVWASSSPSRGRLAGRARARKALRGCRTAGDLAGQFNLSRPAVAEHAQVLRRADLVRDEVVGRQRHYHLAAEPLEQLSEWLHPFERFWRDRLRAFAQIVEADADNADSGGR